MKKLFSKCGPQQMLKLMLLRLQNKLEQNTDAGECLGKNQYWISPYGTINHCTVLY